ncbi:MAG: nucleoside triphosphate pyrophosphohydrolase family protein [Candidatus Nanoarchaeia archaeon]
MDYEKTTKEIIEILKQNSSNLNDYQQAAKITAKTDFSSKTEEIMCWGLGFAGEAGDTAGCIKKTYAHGNDQKSGIRENIGDSLWYAAMICNFFGWDMQKILEENIVKLKKRFPQGFTQEDAARGGTRIDWAKQE